MGETAEAAEAVKEAVLLAAGGLQVFFTRLCDVILPPIMAFVILIWAIVGLWWLAACFYEGVLSFIYCHFVRKPRTPEQLKGRFGQWVTVIVDTCDACPMRTAITAEFYSRGFNILLLVINCPDKPSGSSNALEEEMRKMKSKTILTTGGMMRIARMELPATDDKMEELRKQLPPDASLRFFVRLTTRMTEADNVTSAANFLECNVLLPTFISSYIREQQTNLSTRSEGGGKVTALFVHLSTMATELVYPQQRLLGASQSFIHQISKHDLYYPNPHVKTQVMLALSHPTHLDKLLFTTHTQFASNVYSFLDYEYRVAPSWRQVPLVWLARVLPETLVAFIARLLASRADAKEQ